MNIILLSGAGAPTRTIALDWRHCTVFGLGLLVLVVGLAVAFDFLVLQRSDPLLPLVSQAERKQESERTQELIDGHLNAMAVRLGELQAQMLRLDGLGERLARLAGLKPQELSTLRSPVQPGRGGAESTLKPSRILTLPELTELIDALARQVDERSDQLGVLEALLMQSSTSRKFLPTLAPIVDGWFSSNFGYRIDPFSGQYAFHEGIDFPAEPGTPIVAAASGKVIAAEYHPQYGRMIEIDHGNGVVSRYAHTSRMQVKAGDLVVRGQQVGTVGSTGRSTGPHLHFEVRLNGVPQNPARFLQSPG